MGLLSDIFVPELVAIVFVPFPIIARHVDAQRVNDYTLIMGLLAPPMEARNALREVQYTMAQSPQERSCSESIHHFRALVTMMAPCALIAGMKFLGWLSRKMGR